MKGRAVKTIASIADVRAAVARFCDAHLSRKLDTKPVADVHQKVSTCVHAVDAAMTPYIFGSTAVLGVHEHGSDVDFVCLSPADVSDGTGADAVSEVAKGLQADFLNRLSEEVKREHFLWDIDLVRRTRVPVLRVKGGMGTDGVSFDVTANRRNGVRNSALLRCYLTQHPDTRWLSMLVKQWSKKTGLNASVEGGCITSYGWNMMVAYYLVQRNMAKLVPVESCDVAQIAPMPPYLPLDAPQQNGQVLAEMMQDFLHFYLHEFKPETEVISLNRPAGETTKEMLSWTKNAEDMARIRGEKVHYRWCIEDPYEYNLNVGRNVTPFKAMLLRKHLERAQETGLLLLTPVPATAKNAA
ncbi:putative mitochondrial poly(A) polymerase [Leptomonas pyrrhocoris]|uniref:RNA uridylyltransferase n=1 Tax=Leptomonas pyrrhocoris TaxID=157538 RepID=A0A0N0VHD8_LEPPY|nr:putative mitochondrial poly(A) polymerase [Leptomonas pyrrhocoris]KPA84838.1 putative mitochondrial poly(A) polymerase [Leptomonas pyrrhocoris]|eukprot:XP_015663277.1 putative mitochondrial poly(A) polymerase [Leptomonas pyrrhocoris]